MSIEKLLRDIEDIDHQISDLYMVRLKKQHNALRLRGWEITNEEAEAGSMFNCPMYQKGDFITPSIDHAMEHEFENPEG